MKRISLFLLMVVALGAAAQAEPDVAPVPRIKPVGGSKSWIITYQYKGPNPYLTPPTPAEANFYQKMRDLHPREAATKISKLENRRMQVEDFDDGTENITYVYDGYLLRKERKTNYIQVNKLAQVTDPLVAEDFAELSWVSQAQYKGKQDYQGKTCWMYEMPAGNDFTKRTAYVDKTTGLPSAVVLDGLTINYAYFPDTPAITLPREFEARLKKYIADHKLVDAGG